MTVLIPPEMKEALRDLGTCLAGLGPYRNNMVVVGGMVPLLYRYLESVRPIGRDPLATFDLDIALPTELEAPGRPRIADLLEAAAFESRLRGSVDPPVAVYQHARHRHKGVAPIHIEFLAPLSGPSANRAGNRRRLVEVQSGFRAQSLRYLGLLLEQPITVQSTRVPPLETSTPGFDFLIPHPAMFVLQKALCRDTRSSAKRDKDLAHIFDTVTLFTPNWAEMGQVATDVASRGSTYATWIDDAKQKLIALFDSPTADGPISVRRTYGGSANPSAPSEEGVFRILTRFLDDSGLRFR